MGNWDWRKDRAATLRAWVPHVAGKTSSAPVARAPLPGVPSLSGAADKLAGFINPFYQPEGAGSSSFESSLGAPAAAEPEAYTGGAFVKKQFKAPAGGSGPAAAPAGLAQLAAGGGAPGQPVNPLLAAVQKDPTLLAKPVVLGSTTTSNYQRGLKSMPLFQEGLERTAKAQTEAVTAGAEAQARGLEEKAFLSDMRAFEMKEQEVKRQKQQADYKAKVDEFNADMTAKREEISTAKDLDAGRWWSSRSVGQKIALGLAAALQGFMQGYRGQSGPAPVLSMMERAIDR
ncbi:hypothetical protein CMI37_37715, partial [Candidatus Pacearchaeota archaeon]|nr:hypothetical protein [Candidatus Pacearchaeota archaeon]